MVLLFGQSAVLRLIVTLYFIYQRHHHRVKSWNLYFYNRHIYRADADANAVTGKGAPLNNCFGFVYRTIAGIFRPVLILIRMRVAKSPHPIPVATSTNVGISPQNFLTFSANPFAILV